MTPRRRPNHVFVMSVFAAASFVVAPVQAATFAYSCVLNPLQESPPSTGSIGFGGGRFIIDTDANTVTYWLVVSHLAGTEFSAHIHGSATSTPGNNAPLLTSLPAGNPKIGVWNYSEAQEPMILGGLCYANVHSSGFPDGEIRGQIVPLNATLDAAQETPPTVSSGRGWATFTVDTEANVLSYYVSYENLTGPANGGHIHGAALHGVPAGVKFTFPSLVSPMSGTWTYPQNDEAALLAGRMYVNLHTAANIGGEIRGQICPIVVPMDALQESPVVPELGSAGIALVALDTLANTLSYDVRIDALSSAELFAHIHGFAPLGSGGPLQSGLPAGARKLGSWTYGAANEANVLAGNAYFNSHTANYGDGEIRGQIIGLPQPALLLSVGGGPRLVSGLVAAPNPFGARTELSFQLPRTGSVSLTIVGVDGGVIRSVPAALFAPGSHHYEWDGRTDEGSMAAAGVYFAIVRTPDGQRTTRIARLR